MTFEAVKRTKVRTGWDYDRLFQWRAGLAVVGDKNHFFFIFLSQFEHNSLVYCSHKDKKSNKY